MATAKRTTNSTKPKNAEVVQKSGLLKPNIGLSDATRSKVADILNICVSNTAVLYAKTRNYHWNVTGIHFQQLHLLFESQYTQLAESADLIAERIRQLGGISVGTLTEFKQCSTLSETPGEVPEAPQMVRNLLADHEQIIRELRQAADVTEELKDMGTNDFLIGLMEAHEKMAWFLRAHLEG